MEIAPNGAVIRIESTWAFSSHLGLVAQLLIIKFVTSNDAKEKLTLFSKFLHTAKVRISRPMGSHSGLLNFLALSRKTGPMAAWCTT